MSLTAVIFQANIPAAPGGRVYARGRSNPSLSVGGCVGGRSSRRTLILNGPHKNGAIKMAHHPTRAEHDTGVCATRALKNVRHLQKVAPHLMPMTEPEEG